MPTPYQAAALAYWEAGWSPIPLPHEQKFPVPDDPKVTGAVGVYLDRKQVAAWVAPKARAKAGKLNYPPSNIALRLPKTVIGIDVDAYGEKKGEETLAKAEMEWGALPPTWISTSKDDGISGIRFFTIPEGLEWPGELPQGKGVELIRWDHRYAIVAPSVHDKTKATYGWREEVENGDGEVIMEDRPGDFPAVDDIAQMPETWVEGLTGGKRYEDRAVDEDMSPDDIQEWLELRPDPRVLCASMRATVTKYSREIRQASDDGGAHDEARNGVWALLGDAKAGHTGIVKALTELRNVFLAAVAGRRPDEGTPKKEWARAVARGIRKVTADENPEVEEDPCTSIKRLRPREEGGRLGSADIVYRFDDIGNAERLIRVMNGRARWVEASATWMLWSGSGWAPDTEKQVDRWAVKAVNQMEEELAHLEGDAKVEVINAFKAHKKTSGSVGKLRAMVDVAKGRKGIILPAETFDGNPRLLACANGVVELGQSSVEFRTFHEEQYITLNTNVDYKPEASSPMWESFLNQFQPDPEIRGWLQRIVGYSLLGWNPSRFFVAFIGPTSTGKSTFAEAIRSVLGGYAGPMTASVLRDNADDKPRPDVLAALPRRIIIAEELGVAQHLHQDQIKRLTGGSLVSVRGMRSNVYVSRRPSFTPWIVANDPPTIEGADAALKRRLIVVPFMKQIKQEKERVGYLEDLLASSAEAILAWAVEGYRMWLLEPNLGSTPAGALAASLAFSAGMSDLHTFLSECCDTGEEFSVTPTQLYAEYERWCIDNNIPDKGRMSVTMFGRKLGTLDFQKGKKRVNGKVIDVRTGLRIVESNADKMS